MAPALAMQRQVLQTAIRCFAKRSNDAAARQKLNDLGIPKSGRFFHTAIKKYGSYDSSSKMDHPDLFPPWYDGPEPSRAGGETGGDEAARRGLGADADNWKNWSPDKMEKEGNYLMRLNRMDLDSEENWMSYGACYVERLRDLSFHRFYSFMFWFQIFFVFFFGYYQPDFKKMDWVQREAFLELARRESLNLPLIDPDYIPPSKMLLPTDEELEEMGVEPLI